MRRRPNPAPGVGRRNGTLRWACLGVDVWSVGVGAVEGERERHHYTLEMTDCLRPLCERTVRSNEVFLLISELHHSLTDMNSLVSSCYYLVMVKCLTATLVTCTMFKVCSEGKKTKQSA